MAERDSGIIGNMTFFRYSFLVLNIFIGQEGLLFPILNPLD